MPIVEVRDRNLFKPESAWLLRHKHNVTSQGGEDGIIAKIFEIIGAENQWCVEFGAWDGQRFSNSWRLLNEEGWQGVLIEGDGERFKALEATYAGKTGALLVNRFVTADGGDRLDALLAGTPAPKDLDLMCIDVDGLDWHIWKSLTDYRPRLVVIEFNFTVPNDVYFVQDADPDLHHGASLLALIELGREKGYELVAATQFNALFVQRQLFGKFGVDDNGIDAMFSPGLLESKLFQLYDGTLVLAGCDKLVYRAGMPIDQEDIQVLPKALRVYQG